MSSIRIIVVAICVFLWSFSGQKAFAIDNGVIKTDLPDAAVLGMGTADTGDADRPSAVDFNPAGITQMVGPAVSAGLTFLQPDIKYTSDSGNSVNMNRDNYFFPSVYVTTPIVKDKFYVGVGETSDYGAGNDWAANSPANFTRYATLADSFVDQDYMLVAAYKINDQWSVGAGAIDDQSKFEHSEALNQSPDGTSLFKANDNAWGFTLAALFKLNDMNQFGIDYKSPIHHTYDGTLYLNGLNPAALGSPPFFNGTSFSTEAIQKFTMPQTVTLGYTLKPTSKWKINFDLGWTDWSQYKQQTTYYPNVTNGNQLFVLGLGNPQPRDWTSVWSEALGAEYSVTDAFRVRAGYAHHQTPIPGINFDTQFPDSDSNAYSAGFGYDITKNITIDVAYAGVFYVSRSIVNSVGSVFAGIGEPYTMSGKYQEFVSIGEATLTYKF
jgi:long-chain fatty acid transport protein